MVDRNSPFDTIDVQNVKKISSRLDETLFTVETSVLREHGSIWPADPRAHS
jgi:hypothetical protein